MWHVVQVRQTGGGGGQWWESIAAFDHHGVALLYANDCRDSNAPLRYRVVSREMTIHSSKQT
jgi:hypothetical protein